MPRYVKYGAMALIVVAFGVFVVMASQGDHAPSAQETASMAATSLAAEQPSATPAPLPITAAQRAAFRDFYAHLAGAEKPCDDATAAAQVSMDAVTKGGDTLQAYEDAGTASTTCDSASVALNLTQIPDGLPVTHLDDAKSDLVAWASDERSIWADFQKVLQTPNDLGSLADADSKAKDAKQASVLASVWLATAGIHLGVPLDKVTPIPAN